MRHRRRSVSYAGQPFSFDLIEKRNGDQHSATWAVSRRGEFIGTMTTAPEITTKEFDLRCTAWLEELLGEGQEPRR